MTVARVHCQPRGSRRDKETHLQECLFDNLNNHVTMIVVHPFFAQHVDDHLGAEIKRRAKAPIVGEQDITMLDMHRARTDRA